MAFVVTEGALRALEQPVAQAPYAMRLSDSLSQDYSTIWRTQPAVRTVVSFLARNIASLGLHTFRRVSDTDRERLTDHPLAQLLSKPNPFTTRYRLMDAVVHDLGIYDEAFLLKVRGDAGMAALVRIPAPKIKPVDDGWLAPTAYIIEGNRGKRRVKADEIVHLHGYNPDDSRVGSSPLESLRRILIEEYEAGRMREQTFRNGARMSGYIKRPPNAEWSDRARDRFRKSWQSQYAGGGPGAGGTPILEDGMEFVPASMDPRQLQYVESRKLTREEVASAYFIPPPMVGILDNASFSNITEQHKMLYQDTLGPWLTMLSEDLMLQLLPEFSDQDAIYLEFNLAEKLRGSFEEQAQAASTATGRPWMTANEQRARNNLPAIEGGDDLVVPLNVLVGGQASPRDSAPEGALAAPKPTSKAAAGAVSVKGRAPETHEEKHAEVLAAFFKRQAAVIKSKLGAGEDWWDGERWDRELAADLYRLALQTSETVAKSVLDSIGFGPDAYDLDRTMAFLAAVSDRVAGAVNVVTKQQLDEAVADDEPTEAVAHVFDVATESRTDQIARTAVTAVSGFATVEAAKQAAGEEKAWKVWVTGSNPRSSHARMDGEAVPVGEKFSNGALWPGDGNLAVKDTANCNCSIRIQLT